MSTDDETTHEARPWAATLVRSWWVILALVVLGALVGGFAATTAPKKYSATSSVYLGQTTDPQGATLVGLATNPRAATQLLASKALLAAAAQATGLHMGPRRLRRETTAQTVTQGLQANVTAVAILAITVSDANRLRATAAANALAQGLVAGLLPGADAHVTLLEQQLAAGRKAEAAATVHLNAARTAVAAIGNSGSASQKAAAQAPYVALSQAAAGELAQLQANDQAAALQLQVARSVELPRIVALAAIPDAPSGSSGALSVAAGAFAGLVAGVVVAFVRERLRGA